MRTTPLFVVLAAFSAPLIFATDYYISPGGSDTNPGTSMGAPWRSIAKVNSRSFAAGDRIFFEAGRTFSGSLYFDSGDAGSAANPISVSTYGNGRATINAGSAAGMYAYNTAGFQISNLVFTGSGASSNTRGGIEFYNDRSGNIKLEFVHMDNIEASGFRHGILIGGWNGASGFRDVRITNCNAHHNQRSGISTYAAALYGHANVYVSHCTANDNLGDSALPQPTGNGIVLGEVDGGVIERSIAFNNGILSQPGQGPVGIWTYNSNNVIIQHNEAYANRTGGNTDGGGFDLDIAVTNSVMQYNYSHDNDGAGYGLYQGNGVAPWSGNIVRYNISQNDGRKNSYGAITAWTNGGTFANCQIYGNTIYVSPSSAGSPRAIRFNSSSAGFHFRNNLILTTGGLRLLDVLAGQTDILFQGNNYYTYGAPFSIDWAGAVYTSLAAFSTATGQEKLSGAFSGKNADPLLSNPGGGPTIGFPDSLETLTAYRLQAASPMVDSGLNLRELFGIDPGPRDYYGSVLPQGSGFDIGAHESETTAVNQPPKITSAAATPGSTTAALSVAATDDGGEPSLIYTWATVSAPAGGSVAFSANGTNAAKASIATFSKAGKYVLHVTVSDAAALTDSLELQVDILQALARIGVTPATATVSSGRTQQFTATALDQFGAQMSPQPSFSWTITGPNTITQTGLASAGARPGNFTVTAAASGKSGTANLRVIR